MAKPRDKLDFLAIPAHIARIAAAPREMVRRGGVRPGERRVAPRQGRDSDVHGRAENRF
jgi:hypothetical protein